MAEPPPFPTVAAMEGHGAYNRMSRVQASGLAPALPLLERAAASALLPPAPEAIVIADYGASQGHNSLAPMAAAIGRLRQRVGRERAISVVHTDRPDNDFATLFQTLASDPDSYLPGDAAVFPSAVGRSFYEQILPPASVTLGWSSWAVQWLSRAPAAIPDQVQISFSRDPAARAAYAARAAEDWRTFLIQRSRELRPGGRLLVMTMALDEAGDMGYRPLVEAIYSALMDLVAEGFIQPDEAQRMAIPTVGRGREEFTAPFGADGRFCGLSIEQLELYQGEDRIWTEFERQRDARTYAASWAAFPRASVLPTLAADLDGGSADPRIPDFIARMVAGIETRMAAAPQRMRIPLAMMLIAKDGG
jgi:hypothetical protein